MAQRSSRPCGPRPGMTQWRGSAARRAQARNQPLDVAGHCAPIREPVARESDDQLGRFDPTLIEASTGSEADAAGATHEESRRVGIVNEILSLIRRAIAEREDG